MSPELVDKLAWGAATATSLIAALTDLRSGKIPNWLAYPSLGVALIYFGIVAGLDGLASSAVGALVGSGVFLALFLAGAGGGGDVKLFGALGAWLFAAKALEVCMYTVFAAAVVALAKLTWHGKLGQTLKNALLLFVNAFLPKSKRRELKKEAFAMELLGPSTLIGVLVAAFLHFNGY